MTWRLYYGDGTTLDGEGPLPPGGDARGVQAIVQDHEEVGGAIVTSSDYYVLKGGQWRGVDIFGLFDFLLDSGTVVMGRTIRREEYQTIIREALKTKETWLPGERKFD